MKQPGRRLLLQRGRQMGRGTNGLERLGLILLIGLGVGYITGDVFAGFGAAVFAWIAMGIFIPRRRGKSRSSSGSDSDSGVSFALWSRDDRIDNDGRVDNDSGGSGGDWGGSDSGGGDSGGGDGGGGD